MSAMACDAVKTKVEVEETVVDDPVSPTGQYFNSSVLSIGILAIFESDVAIDDSPTMSTLENLFLPIHPRFSSVMVHTLSLSLSHVMFQASVKSCSVFCLIHLFRLFRIMIQKTMMISRLHASDKPGLDYAWEVTWYVIFLLPNAMLRVHAS